MKRQKRKAALKKRQANAAGEQAAKSAGPRKKQLSRRALLENIGYYAVGAAVIGGGGWYFVGNVRAGMAEQDLSRLGNGIPTIVQIHDPQCQSCLALQRETREALSGFEEGSIQYLVANIREEEGRQLANKYGVGHVTLLLFNGRGRQVGVLVGENRSDFLEAEFRRLARKPNAG